MRLAPATQPSLFEEPRPQHPARVGRASIGSRANSRLLTPGAGAASFYDYTLNPYVGCAFGCSYCFAANFVADEEKKAAWGTWVEIKETALKELDRVDLRDKTVFMSSATDPYQPVEAQALHTRRIVEHLSPPYRQPRLTVQTRSPLVARDLDLIARYRHARVQMSITTDSEEVRKRFEPSCASIDRRFEALEAAVAAGVPVGVSVAPMLPMEDPDAFARRILALNPAIVAVQGFRRNSKPFSADTRAEGLRIAAELGWCEAEYRRCMAVLKAYLGDRMWEGPSGFKPAGF